MKEVLIEVKGGLIQQIYCNSPYINVRIIDYDNIEQGDELNLSPEPVLFATDSQSFRDFFTDNDPLTREIRDELQRLHL